MALFIAYLIKLCVFVWCFEIRINLYLCRLINEFVSNVSVRENHRV